MSISEGVLFGVGLIACGAVSYVLTRAGFGFTRLPPMKPAPGTRYERPEDRPRPVVPPKPCYTCTNCGHGRNIVNLSTWQGGPL